MATKLEIQCYPKFARFLALLVSMDEFLAQDSLTGFDFRYARK